MLYNAVKILEMKYEGKMEKLKDEMREKGERSYLSGCALIVYGRDKYYGIFSGVNYANLVAERTAKITAKATTREFVRELEKILAERGQKKKITELTKKLKQEQFSYSLLLNSRDYFAHNRVGIAFFPSLPLINHQQR
ncbi:unnamed protein product [marine sediment metagenome]|uniref:Uncharacterized protein n=1 Tax=marine sediment metagenome TaxID=412755 RepID=X1HX84_9ZZZZ